MLISTAEHYRFLFEKCSDGVAILSPAWQIMDANPAFGKIFGFSKSKIAGTKFCSLFVDQSACNSLMREIEQNESLKDFPLRTRIQNGVQVNCLVDGGPFGDGSSNHSAYQVIFHVANDSKKSSDGMIYEERIKAFGEMAGAAAHNFRNLLQIIVSGTRMALSNLESGNISETKTSLEQILGNMRSASETARLLSHFANVKRDRAMQSGRLFDLSHAAQKAIDMSRAWLESHPDREGIKIYLTSRLQPGLMVKGVQNEILEAVINLIWNAADALPDGGEILVQTKMEGLNAVLLVKDNGIGIPEEHFDKIFQPFWTTKGIMGKGLGLPGSYGIISHHRGKISLESEPGKGTTFIVKFPLAEQGEAIRRIREVQGIDFSYRILVVDDLEPLLGVLRGGLAQRGQTVFSALSGKEALGVFASNPVDVIICDLAMPEMNGWQVGKAIKTACQRRRIPKPLFIMLTGWSEELDSEHRLIESGVDRVMEKPVDLPKLIKVIRELAQENR